MAFAQMRMVKVLGVDGSQHGCFAYAAHAC
jgi:hypothetical protein